MKSNLWSQEWTLSYTRLSFDLWLVKMKRTEHILLRLWSWCFIMYIIDCLFLLNMYLFVCVCVIFVCMFALYNTYLRMEVREQTAEDYSLLLLYRPCDQVIRLRCWSSSLAQIPALRTGLEGYLETEENCLSTLPQMVVSLCMCEKETEKQRYKETKKERI